MASCNLCSSFGRVKIQYNHDLASEHAKTHFLQMRMIDDDGIEMNKIFDKCFPDFSVIINNSRPGPENSSRRDLMALCHSIFTPKSLMDSSLSHIICEKCDAEIKITDRRKCLKPYVLIEHACGHLPFSIYECQHCDRVFKTKGYLSHHIVTNHQLRTATGQYRDKADDFVVEISAMIKACFGGRKKSASSDGVTIRSASISTIRALTKGSHLTVDRQLHCYRLIRKRIDRNGKVQCRLCSKRIAATDGKNILCLPIKEHANRHLTTPLYRCRICSESHFALSAVDSHLRSAHALSCLEQNYECLADEYHGEVVGIMNKCYGDHNDSGVEVTFRNVNESRVCKKSTRSKSIRSELTLSRQLLCYRLIRKCAVVGRRVKCRLCSKQIIINSGTGITSDRAMQHAFLHLGKTVFQCAKCRESCVTRINIARHLKVAHALPLRETNYQYFADQFHDELEGILRQCYGIEGDEEDASTKAPTSVKREPNATASGSRLQSKLTTERQTLCKQLVREHSDRTDERLQCRLCNIRISVKGARIGEAMNHALVHLEKPMYRCKICSEMSKTRSNIGCHVTRKHDLPMANNYDSLADQYHAEIMEILRKCYNNGITNEAKPFKSRARAEASVRSRLNGSKLTVARQLFCYRLITKFVNSDGKVECRLCKKGLVAKRGEHNVCSPAMLHALVHLKKPIYRCVVCSETCPYDSYMKNHLKTVHALPLANNYECLSDEYHSEILAKLSQCYGEL